MSADFFIDSNIAVYTLSTLSLKKGYCPAINFQKTFYQHTGGNGNGKRIDEKIQI